MTQIRYHLHSLCFLWAWKGSIGEKVLKVCDWIRTFHRIKRHMRSSSSNLMVRVVTETEDGLVTSLRYPEGKNVSRMILEQLLLSQDSQYVRSKGPTLIHQGRFVLMFTSSSFWWFCHTRTTTKVSTSEDFFKGLFARVSDDFAPEWELEQNLNNIPVISYWYIQLVHQLHHQWSFKILIKVFIWVKKKSYVENQR